MIKYKLICENSHEFEGWFQNSAAFEAQSASGQLACPACSTVKVTKAIMAPSVSSRSGTGVLNDEARQQAAAFFAKVRAEVEAKAEYVGPRFADEARRIHNEASEPKAIYGEATLDDAKALSDEGVPVFPLPRLAKDQN